MSNGIRSLLPVVVSLSGMIADVALSFHFQEPFGVLARTFYPGYPLQWSKILIPTLAEFILGYASQGRSGMYLLVNSLYAHYVGLPPVVYVLAIPAHVCGGYVSTRWGHRLGFSSTGFGLQERIPSLPVPAAIHYSIHKPNPFADVRFGFFLASLLFIAIASASMLMLPEVVTGWVTHFTAYAGMLTFTAYHVGFRL